MAISIRQVHPTFVGEVSGVDITRPLTRDEVDAIEAGMHEYSVLVFHDQPLTDEQQAGLLRLATAGDYTTPTCPSCAVKMTKREPKAGGKTFWGCVNFPRCKSIINMAKA